MPRTDGLAQLPQARLKLLALAQPELSVCYNVRLHGVVRSGQRAKPEPSRNKTQAAKAELERPSRVGCSDWLGGDIAMATLQPVIRDSWHGRATKPNLCCSATLGEIHVLRPQHPIAAGLGPPDFAIDEFPHGHPQK